MYNILNLIEAPVMNFYYGVILGILIGLAYSIILNKKKHESTQNNNILNFNKIEKALDKCKWAISTGHTSTNTDRTKISNSLTDVLLDLDNIDHDPLKNLRRPTIVFVQAVQYHLDNTEI